MSSRIDWNVTFPELFTYFFLPPFCQFCFLKITTSTHITNGRLPTKIRPLTKDRTPTNPWPITKGQPLTKDRPLIRGQPLTTAWPPIKGRPIWSAWLFTKADHIQNHFCVKRGPMAGGIRDLGASGGNLPHLRLGIKNSLVNFPSFWRNNCLFRVFSYHRTPILWRWGYWYEQKRAPSADWRCIIQLVCIFFKFRKFTRRPPLFRKFKWMYNLSKDSRNGLCWFNYVQKYHAVQSWP